MISYTILGCTKNKSLAFQLELTRIAVVLNTLGARVRYYAGDCVETVFLTAPFCGMCELEVYTLSPEDGGISPDMYGSLKYREMLTTIFPDYQRLSFDTQCELSAKIMSLFGKDNVKSDFLLYVGKRATLHEEPKKMCGLLDIPVFCIEDYAIDDLSLEFSTFLNQFSKETSFFA